MHYSCPFSCVEPFLVRPSSLLGSRSTCCLRCSQDLMPQPCGRWLSGLSVPRWVQRGFYTHTTCQQEHLLLFCDRERDRCEWDDTPANWDHVWEKVCLGSFELGCCSVCCPFILTSHRLFLYFLPIMTATWGQLGFKRLDLILTTCFKPGNYKITCTMSIVCFAFSLWMSIFLCGGHNVIVWLSHSGLYI